MDLDLALKDLEAACFGLQWIKGRGARFKVRGQAESFLTSPFELRVCGLRARRVSCLSKRLLQRFSCFENVQTKAACCSGRPMPPEPRGYDVEKYLVFHTRQEVSKAFRDAGK